MERNNIDAANTFFNIIPDLLQDKTDLRQSYMRYQLVGNRKILADELSASIIMEAHRHRY